MQPINMYCPDTGQKSIARYRGDHTRLLNLGWLEGFPPAKPIEQEAHEEFCEGFKESVFSYDPESD